MASQSERITKLAELARSGNPDALEQLTNRFTSKIYRMVYYRIGSAVDAEDVTQDIFVQLFKNIAKLKDPQRFSPWLYRIAVNRIKDYLRKKRLRRLFWISKESDTIEKHTQAQTGNPIDSITKKEFWQQFFAAMDLLSPMEREVFILRFVDELKLKEIVYILSKNESTIKTHLYRAVKKFKDTTTLDALLEDDSP
jgi:RNA polymerase sigma-70 factor (ECF subfamily)